MKLFSTTRNKNGFPIKNNRLDKKHRPSEALIQTLLFLAGILSIFTTLGIVVTLGREAWLFFRLPEVNLLEFLTGTTWQPHIQEFGILPLATATLVTTAIAMVIAIPLGLTVAIFLSEYASQKIRNTLKPILELLAGIPTIVYGYFALTFVTPLLRGIFGRDVVNIYNTGSAGLVMGILILPLIASISEDALTAVPRSLREAFWARATKSEVGSSCRPGCLSDRRGYYSGNFPRHWKR
jgi:phosphate transport system permease protein